MRVVVEGVLLWYVSRDLRCGCVARVVVVVLRCAALVEVLRRFKTLTVCASKTPSCVPSKRLYVIAAVAVVVGRVSVVVDA